jgi:hypothetical protein
MDGVYSKIFSRTLSFPAKNFTSKFNHQDVIAPFGPFKLMQATRSEMMAIRAGAIVSESLTPPQSTVTKTTTEQTPYPELHTSRPGRESVANIKSKFQISTRVRLESASRIFNHLEQEKSDANYTQA